VTWTSLISPAEGCARRSLADALGLQEREQVGGAGKGLAVDREQHVAEQQARAAGAAVGLDGGHEEPGGLADGLLDVRRQVHGNGADADEAALHLPWATSTSDHAPQRGRRQGEARPAMSRVVHAPAPAGQVDEQAAREAVFTSTSVWSNGRCGRRRGAPLVAQGVNDPRLARTVRPGRVRTSTKWPTLTPSLAHSGTARPDSARGSTAVSVVGSRRSRSPWQRCVVQADADVLVPFRGCGARPRSRRRDHTIPLEGPRRRASTRTNRPPRPFDRGRSGFRQLRPNLCHLVSGGFVHQRPDASAARAGAHPPVGQGRPYPIGQVRRTIALSSSSARFCPARSP